MEKNKDNIDWINKNIIMLEDVLKDNKKINISKDELKQFLNGVKIYYDAQDGLYCVYCEGDFIGSCNINNKKLKRDIVI